MADCRFQAAVMHRSPALQGKPALPAFLLYGIMEKIWKGEPIMRLVCLGFLFCLSGLMLSVLYENYYASFSTILYLLGAGLVLAGLYRDYVQSINKD